MTLLTAKNFIAAYPYACQAADKILAKSAGTTWERHAKALALYLREGRRPDAGLEAILVGNLYDAVKCADPTASAQMAAIARAMMFYAPKSAFGSHRAVDAWIVWHAKLRPAHSALSANI